MFLFGGYGADPMYPSVGVMNDLWMYNTAKGWVMLVDNGTNAYPPPRYGHSTEITNTGELLLFGGQQLYGGMNDLWLFNSSKWTLLPATVAPVPRSGQMTALIGERLWVFGGIFDPDGEPEYYHNDLWYYNLVSQTWVQAQPDSDVPPPKDQPWKRKGGSLVILGAGFYLFAGYTWFTGLQNDLWRYTIEDHPMQYDH